MTAFNIFSALNLGSKLTNEVKLYVPRPSTSGYISAPEVTSFDESLYDEGDPNSIVNILKGFYENDNLIGYQRIGDRKDELTVWQNICNSVSFIRDIF